MGEKILVVDDERPVREVVALILERAGYEMVRAANGWEAIEVAARENPQLIILDMRMPGLHGIDTCRELRSRQETRGIPILVLTAYVENEKEALEAGVDDFLTKPFRPEELIARVKTLLKVRHLQHEAERALPSVGSRENTLLSRSEPVRRILSWDRAVLRKDTMNEGRSSRDCKYFPNCERLKAIFEALQAILGTTTPEDELVFPRDVESFCSHCRAFEVRI